VQDPGYRYPYYFAGDAYERPRASGSARKNEFTLIFFNGNGVPMAAFMVVKVTLRDSAWRHSYRANVPAILSKHGGEYLAASESVEMLEGTQPAPDLMAILKFPTLAAVKAFLADDAYRPYREARIASSYAEMAAFEV
jgi:uncharacterized protein (DUF1330 family)